VLEILVTQTILYSIVNSGKIQTSDWIGLGLDIGVVRTLNHKLLVSCLLYCFLALLFDACILAIHSMRNLAN
jgi:hypothetical protein